MRCRLDDSCTYNAPNFVSALILSVATQMTIGAVSLTSFSEYFGVCLPLLRVGLACTLYYCLSALGLPHYACL